MGFFDQLEEWIAERIIHIIRKRGPQTKIELYKRVNALGKADRELEIEYIKHVLRDLVEKGVVIKQGRCYALPPEEPEEEPQPVAEVDEAVFEMAYIKDRIIRFLERNGPSTRSEMVQRTRSLRGRGEKLSTALRELVDEGVVGIRTSPYDLRRKEYFLVGVHEDEPTCWLNAVKSMIFEQVVFHGPIRPYRLKWRLHVGGKISHSLFERAVGELISAGFLEFKDGRLRLGNSTSRKRATGF